MAQAGPSEDNHGYYEIKNGGNKGRGAFALKTIFPGTRILFEDALFIIEKHAAEIKTKDIISKMNALTPAMRRHFQSLPFAPRYATASASEKHYGRFHRNNFSILDKGWGCFVHASRFNNSCLPDCAVSQNRQGSIQICVTRKVSKKEELTFAYNQIVQYLTTDERQALLRPLLDDSPCICELCSRPADQRSQSDERRKLMRHLAFLLRGEDFEGMALDQITPSNYNPFSTFRVASEAAGWFVALASAEGIVGTLIWDVYAKGAHDLLRHFKTSGTVQLSTAALDTAKL
ncbi:hypothetical protein CBER1_09922 [Cercospora berteroae]|uniref:SET domain-containing protein n=1 Tax=Cercospora berteroae TaxID=357750 RepID=A0A2S6CCQ6_9PEZI|nr:hypothetical protein CBER1_09922 [Cercospora berteroae]